MFSEIGVGTERGRRMVRLIRSTFLSLDETLLGRADRVLGLRPLPAGIEAPAGPIDRYTLPTSAAPASSTWTRITTRPVAEIPADEIRPAVLCGDPNGSARVLRLSESVTGCAGLHRGAAKCQAAPNAAPAGYSLHLVAMNCDPLPACVNKCRRLRAFPILSALVPAPTGNGPNHGKRVNLGFT